MIDVDLLINYELGEATSGETLTLFSQLISTGVAWQLQGRIGRTAADFIGSGLISPEGEITDHGRDLAIIAEEEDLDPDLDPVGSDQGRSDQ